MPVLNEYSRFLYQILLFTPAIISYNVDTQFPILYQNGAEDSYFGFSVGLLANTDGYCALITAPRANSSSAGLELLHQPGALFSCNIPTSGGVPLCKEIEVDPEGNVPYQEKENSADMSYNNTRDDMWLGVSLDVQNVSKDNNVVVCGHLWKNNVSSSGYYVNGACYVLNSDLNSSAVDKIVPFVNKKANEKTSNTLFYERAQAGTSAAFSEDGLSLLLGSPGFERWKGTFVSYHLDKQLGDPIIPDVQFRRPSSTYMGYSITSGNFFGDGIIYRAAGAPRDNGYKGKVYIFLPLNERHPNLDVFTTVEGKQIGEYFGASVNGIDLNGDGLTDLLVGAPFYSHETGSDEGKVYVYVGSTQNKKFLQSSELSVKNKPYARFGTCIGNIGDLNQDGFNDVAIGAPYEDGKGALYIYYGGINGISDEKRQRISAKDFGQPIAGFGISISRGLDIDDNFYPDILIGSYASSTAVLLRTYPVIHLKPTLSFGIPMIDMNISACESARLGGKFPCVNVTYCLTYSGKHVRSLLEFQTELTIDTGVGRDSTIIRGFFLPDGQTQPQASVSRKIQIQAKSNGSCVQETAYIYKNISDVFNPIQFLLNYYLDRNATVSCQSNEFPKDCPVIDSKTATSIPGQIRFKTGCKDICKADLSINAYVAGNPGKRTLIVGQDDTLDVIVWNEGEPAYFTEVFISLPSNTPLEKYDPCEMLKNKEEYVTTTLRCRLRKPLKNGETENIQIGINAKEIPDGTSLTVHFRVTTASSDIDTTNNELARSFNFEAAADVNITGNPENPHIPQTEGKGTVSVTHYYYVRYYGPSPVDKIDINLYVPSSKQVEDGIVPFLTLTSFEAEGYKNSTNCSVPFTNMASKSNDEDEHEQGSKTLDADLSTNNSHHITKSSAEKSAADSTAKGRKDYALNCDNFKCDVISCDTGPFRSGQKSIKLVLTFRIDLDVLSSVMDSWKSIQFITKGEISMAGVKMLSNIYRNETTVETEIFRFGPTVAQEVEKWIIFVSIGIGLLLFFIILIVLIKIGFFKRKQREKMRSMRHQAQVKEMQTVTNIDERDLADDKELCTSDQF